jgi:hypothetical protein
MAWQWSALDGTMSNLMGLPVSDELERRVGGRIQGQLLRRSEHHVVAIYLLDGAIRIADFIDGQGVLVDANTWFRFNCATISTAHGLRRMAIETAIPLSVELIEKIEALHRESHRCHPETAAPV